MVEPPTAARSAPGTSSAAKKNIQSVYALTSLQEGMLFHTLYDPDSADYLELTHFRLRGSVTPEIFEAAWNELLRRHDILRTAFVHKNVPEPLQVVLKVRRIDFQFEELRAGSEAEQRTRLDEVLAGERARRFDLAKDSLMRIRLLQWSEDSFSVVWSYHHIVLDGWSLAVLREEFIELYQALLVGRAPRLPPPVSFGTYVRWLKQQPREASRDFWRRYLAGFDRPSPAAPSSAAVAGQSRPAVLEFSLSASESAELLHRALDWRVTLNALVQGLWSILLAGRNRAVDVVFAATVSGRAPELPGIERLVGLCINAIPVRVRLNPEATFSTLLRQIQADAASAQPHHYGPLAEIQADSALRQNLFDHILVFENYPAEAAAVAPGLPPPPFVLHAFEHADHTNYPLTVQVAPATSLGFRFIFNERILTSANMGQLAELLRNLARQVLGAPEPQVGALLRLAESTAPPAGRTIRLGLAATFTLDPLVPFVEACGRLFGWSVESRLAPYNQVFQQLLDPASAIRQLDGVRLVFIRFEDWLRDVDVAAESAAAVLAPKFELLKSAVAQLDPRQETWFAICPLSPVAADDLRSALEQLQAHWIGFLSGQAHCRCLDFRGLAALYQLGDWLDPRTDQAGHIPFTEEYFACLGVAVTRRLVGRAASPFKVLVTDCDQTLWRGVCGEDGPQGVTIDGGYRVLQEFLTQAVAAGFLVALCSKNEPADVWRVFDNRPEMPLRRSQIVASRISWQPKSESLREIARELNVGLDSLIFLDDSPLECAEVRNRCPAVLTLQLPEREADFGRFLARLWACDRFQLTDEDRRRTDLYQAERSRTSLRDSTVSLDDFLRGLKLRVVLSPVGASQVPRIAQLTQRTNQFNNATIRRTDADLHTWQRLPGSLSWAVHVADQFGDYGLTGVVLARLGSAGLVIDTLALSCRVLGRRVEDAILVGLRRLAENHGVTRVELPFHATERNQIFVEFLTRTRWRTDSSGTSSRTYRIATENLPGEVPGVWLEAMESPWPVETSDSAPGAVTEFTPALVSVGGRSGEPTSVTAPAVATPPSWRVVIPEGCPDSHRGYYQMLEPDAVPFFLSLAAATPAVVPSPKDARINARPPENPAQEKMLSLWQDILGRTGFGVDDDFFALGGHSLKATRLLSRITQAFGQEVSLKEVFDFPTIAQLCRRLAAKQLAAASPIRAVPSQAGYELSHAQRRLWVLQRMEKGSFAYNNSGFYLLEGPLDSPAFCQAMRLLVERHESLRTTFTEVEHIPVQRIHEVGDWQARVLDWTEGDHSLTRVYEFARTLAREPFDLSAFPLIIVYLIRLETRKHALLLHMHHIISDAWSLEVMENEVFTLYSALRQGTPAVAPPLGVQYKDYAAWHNGWMTGEAAAASRAYWLHQFAGELPLLDLPADAPRPPVQTFNGRVHEFSIDAATWSRLRTLGSALTATPFVLLTALLKALLFRYTQQADIVVGTPISGRLHPDLENQVGFFANTLPLRVQVSATQTFSELVHAVKRTVLSSFEHQMYPFDAIVQDLKLPRDLSRPALFDVMMVWAESDPGVNLPAAEGLKMTSLPFDACVSRFDLTFEFQEVRQELRVSLTYNSDRFSPARMGRLGRHFQELMAAAGAHPEQQLGTLNFLTLEESQLLQAGFCASPLPPLRPTTITELFREQVSRTPDRLALISEGRTWTYRELDSASDVLAARLVTEVGLPRAGLVGVLVEERQWAVLAALAIMKAGAAYLPLDPRYPARRLEHILVDSGCHCLLTDHPRELPPLSKPPGIRRLDQLDWGGPGYFPDAEFPPAPNDVAYVIYTSGSTGQPKGVMIEHGGFANMIRRQIEAFAVAENDRVVLFASLAFDASLSEIFMALLAGAALCLPPPEARADAEIFLAYADRLGITVATLPPVFLNTLGRRSFRTLKSLITAGEAANERDAAAYSRDLRYFNAYGPTETSVCATLYQVPPGSTRSPVPIGRGIGGLQVLLLDHNLQLVPIGVPGEICVAGIGLARGYLNQPGLTERKFVPHPFQRDQRLYRTGDRARWTEDGLIEFLGRTDNQVKIRGHRLELDELHHQLCAHESVREAAILPFSRPDGSPALVAYVVAASGLTRAELLAFLAARLPEYAIPTSLIFLDSLPLNVHGKLNKGALPPPMEANAPLLAKLAPRNPAEQAMAEVWSAVLGCPNPGVRDGFFELGGDSITAIQTVSRLRASGWRVEVKDLYLYPDIERLVEHCPRDLPATSAGVTDWVQGEVPLTAIQRWFFQEFPGARSHFNHWEMFHAPQGFDPAAVAAAFTAVQAQHDALRMVYPGITADAGAPEPAQWNNGSEHPVFFEIVNLRGQNNPIDRLQDHSGRLQASLDLRVGPLMKVALYQLDDGDRLLVVIHHLVVDAVSWRILVADFLLAYEQTRRGVPISLPAKTASFQTWAKAVSAYSISAELLTEIPYWRRIETAQTGPLPPPPCDGEGDSNPPGFLEIVLTTVETAAILSTAARLRASLEELLLSVLAHGLGRWSGQSEMLVLLESHGREELVPPVDISRTVGWFTAVFPAILTTGQSVPVRALVPRIQAMLSTVPRHGFGYGILKYMTPSERKDGLAFTARPQISFNYLGHYGRELRGGEIQLAQEPAGEGVGPGGRWLYDLSFNAIVIHDALRLTLVYPPSRFRPGAMLQLMDHLKSELLLLGKD